MLYPLIVALIASVSAASVQAEDAPSSVIGGLETFQREQAHRALHTPLKGVAKAECGCTEGSATPSIVESLSALQHAEEGRSQETQGQDIKVLVFVSSSMNLHDLQTLAEEAKTHQAALVMRGLIEGSFQKTMPFVQSLKGSVMLDPRLFQAFKIETVPTFVRLHAPLKIQGGQDHVSTPAHDVIRGNLTLAGALKVMEGRGM